jgi:hypothetical protein
LNLGTILEKFIGLGIRTSSDVSKADDKGEIANRAMTLISAAHIKLQLVWPSFLRLKQTSMKIDHHALGVWSRVPYALVPPAGAFASLVKGSVLFTSSKRMTVIWAYRTATRVGVKRHPNNIAEEPLSWPIPWFCFEKMLR